MLSGVQLARPPWQGLLHACAHDKHLLALPQIKDMLPENSGNTWGSIYPRDDLMSVASAICTQVASMQAAAEKQYRWALAGGGWASQLGCWACGGCGVG